MHGFSVVLSTEELAALKKTVRFLTAYRDRTLDVDSTHTIEFLSLNTVSSIWPASNYVKDVIIGIIDTGVWPESNSFRDNGMEEIPSRWKICEPDVQFNFAMCNRKLIGARYFNKGIMADDPNVSISMNFARTLMDMGPTPHQSLPETMCKVLDMNNEMK
ncbi:hypothetical protein GIB67_017589 [Kingdonia uniflora]|uniref:Uncharacterized protein n=1 Tax=Kingdonia uniflora TaxID=39325 RepID=A0A7J7LMT4_9MAGN|nr:hypothetical protein GIB67_017589 [Kingdonia uniflora]